MAPEQAQSSTSASNSCRKKKSGNATFLADLRDHLDEFIHASMDEHKECFKKTMEKLFGMSKAVGKNSSDSKGIESVLPLQTTISK